MMVSSNITQRVFRHRISSEQTSAHYRTFTRMIRTTVTDDTTTSTTPISTMITTVTQKSSQPVLRLLKTFTFEMDRLINEFKSFTNNTIASFIPIALLILLCLVMTIVALVCAWKLSRYLHKRTHYQMVDSTDRSSATHSFLMANEPSWKEVLENASKLPQDHRVTMNGNESPVYYYSTIPYVSHYLLPTQTPKLLQTFV